MSGTKDELVLRLIQADKEGMMELVAGTELLTCTQAGREIAEQYTASEKEKRIKVEQQVIGYLAKRMFKEGKSGSCQLRSRTGFLTWDRN